MPSPFPGMDPFIESQRWEGFQTSLVSAIRDALVAKLSPRYDVDVEMRIYLERRDLEHAARTFVADLGIACSNRQTDLGGVAVATDTQIEANECVLPWPEEHREAYLVLRRPHAKEVITVIELLSPTNKLWRANGRDFVS